VPGDHRSLLTERVEQAHHVADKVKERVLLDGLGTIGLSVAAHVGRDRMEAGPCQRAQLVPPRVPAFGKPVAKKDQRTYALFGKVHPNSVRLDARCFSSVMGADLLAAG